MVWLLLYAIGGVLVALVTDGGRGSANTDQQYHGDGCSDACGDGNCGKNNSYGSTGSKKKGMLI